MIGKLVNYIKGTRAELRQVSWPTKKQIINFTMLVIGVSVAVSLFLGLFDAIFGYLLREFVI